MKTFKNYILTENAEHWIASQLADKYKNGNMHMKLDDKDFNAAVELYKEKHPHESEDVINSIDKDKIREIIKKRNSKKLADLAASEDYKTLETELRKVSNSDNKEAAEKAKEILPKVEKLLAASVVTEDDNENLKQEIINACKIIDDLVIKGGTSDEEKLSDKEAQGKMKDLYIELYNKYHTGNLSQAALFLNSAAVLSSDQKTLSWKELALGWKKITAGESFNALGLSSSKAPVFKKDDNLVKGVKFLVGCLALKITLGSDIFGGQGIKVLEKEGIPNDANVNKAISELKVNNIDNSVIEQFKGIKSSQEFLSGLEGLFRTLERLSKIPPKDDLEVAKNQPKEEPENKEEKTPEQKPENKEEKTPEQKPENKEENSDKPVEEPASQESTPSGDKFKVTLKDGKNPDVLDAKIDSYFGKGKESIYQKFVNKLYELSKKLNANLGSKEEVTEEGIYSILKDEELINERLGAYIKNRVDNIGRFTLKNNGNVANSLNRSLKDMEDYQADFLKKAKAYAEIIKSPVESTRKQDKAVQNLNVLAITYKGRLQDCLSHASLKNTLNEVGQTGKDIKDAAISAGKKAKEIYDNTKFGKTAAYDKERVEEASKDFEKIWNKLGNSDKKVLSYAILSGNFLTLSEPSKVMKEKNGQFTRNEKVLDDIVALARETDGFDVRDKNEINQFLDNIKETDWFVQHKNELARYEKQYNECVKAYAIFPKKMNEVIKQYQANLKNQQKQNIANQVQNAANQPQNNIANQIQNAANQPQNVEQANQASVITEEVDENLVNKIIDILRDPVGKQNEIDSGVISFFGNFSKEAIFNAFLLYRDDGYFDKTILQQPAAASVQATVTTGAVGTVYPNRLYANAIRRKINPYMFN
jgi:hypothetical protein